MKYKLRRTRKNRNRARKGGANNNNANNNNNNVVQVNANADNNNGYRVNMYPENRNLIVNLANANLDWLRSHLEDGSLDANGHYEYKLARDNGMVFGGLEVTQYKGTPLGFLAAIAGGVDFHLRQNFLGEDNTVAVFDLLLEYGANVDEAYFQITPEMYGLNQRYGIVSPDHKILNLFLVGRKPRLVKKVINEIAKLPEGWSRWEIANHLADLPLVEELLNNPLTNAEKEKLKQQLQFQKKRGILNFTLQNKFQANKTRRAKLNVAEELRYMPPNPKTGFPGGNEYRKMAEKWASQFTEPSA